MDSNRQTSRTLHGEHVATLDLLARAQRALAGLASGRADAALVRAMAELDHHVRADVARHFVFEERELFPRMIDGDESEMAALLLEEHETIRAVVAELLPLTEAAAADALDAAGWKSLQRRTGELAERLASHIEKEDRGLLPLIDDLIDEDVDRQLALAYASL